VVAVAPAAAPSVVNAVTVSTPSTETTTDAGHRPDSGAPVSVLTLGKRSSACRTEVTRIAVITPANLHGGGNSDPHRRGWSTCRSRSGWQCGWGRSSPAPTPPGRRCHDGVRAWRG
jgi:hypothetical protein